MSIPKKQFSTEVGGKTLAIEISPIAEQANASALVRYGGTAILVTAVMPPGEVGMDYLPLRVDYEERFYAAGKILGSRFIRREGRPSEDAILAGRLVDRVLRPLFDHRIRREIQVVVTVLAIDEENDPDFVGLIGASTALGISDIPWNGPVGGVRVAKIGGDLVMNPNNSALKDAGFETFVAGPAGHISMVELGGNEAPEEEILKAFEVAQRENDRLIEFQKDIVKQIGKPKAAVKLYEPAPELRAAVEAFLTPRLEEAVYQSSKIEQVVRIHALKAELFAHIETAVEKADLKAAEFVFEEMVDVLVHKNILEHGRRPDGRDVAKIRDLSAEVGLFERTHGSALFVRGNTQALAVVTLAAPGAEQTIESMETIGKRRFMLHYNFPSYSVGEVGPFRSPGRREIGHGALAEKALHPLIPSSADFPYAIRVVSEILSSNGSSSMATVCASALALMDAGVPLKKPAAGIAMGLMLEAQTDADRTRTNAEPAKFKILTDLQGPEDFYGDMDFKVAGTADGVNAIQLDVKVHGLTIDIIRQTFRQAKDARLEILKFMQGIIAAPRPALSKYVPTIVSLTINPEKIGLLIGPGGKMINGLIKRYELASIDVEDDGSVFVAADTPEKAHAAVAEIRGLTKEYKIGEIVEGPVVKILDFGAIIDLGGGKDAMIHVSELKQGFVKQVTDVLHVGDVVKAKIINVDLDGHVRLSLKQMTE
jgi:polyribonucleotide nucleotidyltransferase